MSPPPLVQVLRRPTKNERDRLARLEDRIEWLTYKIETRGLTQGHFVAERSALIWIVGLIRGTLAPEGTRDVFDTTPKETE